MPRQLNMPPQTTVQDPANATEYPIAYNDSCFTATGTSMHGPDCPLNPQDNLHQNMLYDPATATQQPTAISPYISDPQAGHTNSQPPTNNQNAAIGTAASPVSHSSKNITNASVYTQNGVNYATRATPVARMKSTGRVVHASTLPLYQLVTDKHLQIDDELHVPLATIVRADGSRQSAHGEVAVMIV